MLINSEVPASAPASSKSHEMLSHFREGGKDYVRINSSSVSVIQECWRKASLTLDQGWRGKIESPALTFGSAIHKALEIFYSSERAERKLNSGCPGVWNIIASGGNTDAHSSCVLCNAVRGFRDTHSPISELPPLDKRSLFNGVWILSHYFKTYIDDPFVTVKNKEGRPMVEESCEFVLHDDALLKITYFGTIDVILQNERTGMIVVCDHKTSSVVGQSFYNQLKPNHQYTGYLLAAKETLGLDTDTFLVNCLEVKAKPKTPRGQDPKFPRQSTIRTKEDYQEFRDTIRMIVSQYLRLEALGIWPLGPKTACSNVYGPCQYLDVCAAPGNLRENILSAKFQKIGM